MIKPSDYFNELLEKAKQDDNIIGFFAVGSRGKGYENESSDYDLCLIVKNETLEEYKKKFGDKVPEVYLSVMSLAELSDYANWQSDFHWDRYDFAHVKALVDKTGEVQKIIDEKGSLPKERQEEFINAQIDAYMNGLFRSVKSYRKNDRVGIRLESAASIPHLLNMLFALEGRIAPFPDYLSRELKSRPLKKLPWPSEKLLEALLRILEDGDLKTQQELAKTVEKVCREEGYGKAFDGWEGKDKWAMEYARD